MTTASRLDREMLAAWQQCVAFNDSHPIGTLTSWRDKWGDESERRTTSIATVIGTSVYVSLTGGRDMVPLADITIIDEVSDVPGLDDDCGLFTPPRNGDAA